jgi:hypothetical protein
MEQKPTIVRWLRRVMYAVLICSLVITAIPFGLQAVNAEAPMAVSQITRQLYGPLPQELEASFTLADLGIPKRVLDSSGDASTVAFGLPAYWDTSSSSATLFMRYSAELVGWGTRTDPEALINRMVLQVSLNGNRLAMLPISGSISETLTFDVPTGVLRTLDGGQRNALIFQLSARFECDELSPVEVTIYNDTRLSFNYNERAIVPDFSRYPFPIVQNSIISDTISLIVPDEPTTNELDAAFITAASFRQLSNSGDIQLYRESELPTDRRDTSNVVLVGQPSRLSMFDEVDWPSANEGDSFPSLAKQGEDGIVQIKVSPWNDARSALLISGSDDNAVLKAAQGLETLRNWPQPAGTAAIIAETRPSQSPPLNEGRQTFAQMGLPAQRVEGVGDQQIDYLFTLPFDHAVPGDAVFGFSYSNSAMVNDVRSYVDVWLNDQAVGSVRLTEDSALGKLVPIVLPRNYLQPGTNRLRLMVHIEEISACGSSNTVDTWFEINEDSYLEFTANNDPALRALPFTLDSLPVPFALHPELANTALIVPHDKPDAWNAAMRVFIYLAGSSSNSLLRPQVAFANDISDDLKQNYNLIIVGEPKDQPILTELKDQMAIVFNDGTNDPDDRLSRVVMSFNPPETQGYVQIAASPWNAQRAVLTLLGRDSKEVGWAASGISRSSLRNRLRSQLALIQQDTSVVPQLILPTAVPTMQPTAMPEPTPTAQAVAPPSDGGSGTIVAPQGSSSLLSSPWTWLSLLAALLILGGGAWFWRNQQRSGLY